MPGAWDAATSTWTTTLARGTVITTDPTDYEDAASLYGIVRRNGEAVPKMLDRLIAGNTIRSGTPCCTPTVTSTYFPGTCLRRSTGSGPERAVIPGERSTHRRSGSGSDHPGTCQTANHEREADGGGIGDPPVAAGRLRFVGRLASSAEQPSPDIVVPWSPVNICTGHLSPTIDGYRFRFVILLEHRGSAALEHPRADHSCRQGRLADGPTPG